MHIYMRKLKFSQYFYHSGSSQEERNHFKTFGRGTEYKELVTVSLGMKRSYIEANNSQLNNIKKFLPLLGVRAYERSPEDTPSFSSYL